MDRKRLLAKLARRVRGIPRTPREFQRSLDLLQSYRDLGWHQSARLGAPVDRDGRPLPFLNYAALAWLAQQVSGDDVVFEYGAGHSTLWFASRVKHVSSVDHNPEWVDRVKRRIPANVKVSALSEAEYVDAIRAFAPESLDIVMVDGIRREECAFAALPYLTPNGLLILDNSDRPENHSALARLRASGFLRIDFVSSIPGFAELTCTSMLFRETERWLRCNFEPADLGWPVPGQQGGYATSPP